MSSIIKVDNVQNQPGTNIINKCGTTITLGQSGDTISLASGASQTGFGRTGTVDWITTPKVTGDSPVTGVTGKGYFLNTTAGAITINLPAGAAGSIVSMADYAGTWQTSNVTVAPNGTEKIGGTNANATLNTQGQSVTFVYVDSTQGWINTMDSTSNVRGNAYITATVSGACNTLVTAPDCANTKIATFLGPGSLCVSAAAACAADNVVSYMVVAGGAGGGLYFGGGGGGGGFREYKSPVTPYTASPLDGNPGGTAITIAASPYPITVGGGGAAAPSQGNGTAGSNSVFSSIISAGGGYGSRNGSPYPGGAGGSGGGGGSFGGPINPGGAGNTPSVSPAQGFAGGSGSSGPPDPGLQAGGGGGGATAVGTPKTPCATARATGGAGATTSIDGTPTGRAGGGGGGSSSPPSLAGAASPCGSGGAGSSPAGCGADATANLGGGGGGGGPPSGGLAKAGGSGVVIVRYKFQ